MVIDQFLNSNKMKKSLYILIIAMYVLLTTGGIQAQVSMVFSMGISPQNSPNGHYVIVNRSNPQNEFLFDLTQVKASYQVGAGVRYDLLPFFLLGEAQYTKREYVYSVKYTYPDFPRSADDLEYNESMHLINVPLSIGVDLGVLEVVSGFVPQFVVAHKNGMDAIEGYSDDLSTIRFGWHTGVAAKIAKFRIGLTYQMDFNNYADHISINSEPIKLTGASGRIMAMVAYGF